MERLVTPGGVEVEAADEAVAMFLANGYRRVEPPDKPKAKPRARRKPRQRDE